MTESDFAVYTLPAHWAPALFNGDFTGLNEDDEEQLMSLIAGENLGDPVGIEPDLLLKWPQTDGNGDAIDPSPSFLTYHDARDYGVPACDCYRYIFPND